MKQIDYRDLLQPILKVVRFIFNKKGLDNSNLYKKTDIIVSGSRISIIMPDYAVFVDKGRKPNSKMPPVKVILEWIRRKNIKIPTGYTQEGFAWAIAKSIARKGIKARNFIQMLRDNIVDIIKDFIRKKADELLKQISKNNKR